MTAPYVVSEDIFLLLEKWAEENGFVIPNQYFFENLREDFKCYMQKIFQKVEIVPEKELRDGLAFLSTECGLPIISLDRAYVNSEYHLDICRMVNAQKEDVGLGRRPGYPKIAEQINNLLHTGFKEVALADDVIFSGELIERVCRLLGRKGIKVHKIIAGIGIGNGIYQIAQNGKEIKCVREYHEVIDEVCERDFYPGVPLSGRTFMNDGGIGFPYILPFGIPGKWASIPYSHDLQFSSFCLSQTIRLFKAIESASGKTIFCHELSRKLINFPEEKFRFVDFLKEIV